MKKKIVCSLLLIICIILLSINVYAKTYAWLISVTENKAQKVDVANNVIIKTVIIKDGLNPSVELQEWENAIIADTGGNLLFVIYDYPGRYMGQGIKVYNLKDLTFKKDLEITSNDPYYNLPKLIIPPVGNKSYVIWWDRSKEVHGEGGETYSVYDKNTLNKISDLASFPLDLYRPWMFSSDGSKLYSVNIDTNEIKVYDSITLALKETISIVNIWGAPLYLKRVVSDTLFLGSGDKILFMENIKSSKSEPNNIKYFVYDIPSKVTSSKMNIIEDDQECLSPNGSKLIINENIVHIYSVSEAKKLKILDLSNRYKDVRILKMATISPDSSKLYLMGENIKTQIPTLLVIDLKSTYSVIAEIPSVEASRMIFFNE